MNFLGLSSFDEHFRHTDDVTVMPVEKENFVWASINFSLDQVVVQGESPWWGGG